MAFTQLNGSQVVFVNFDGGSVTYSHGPTKGTTVTLPGLATSLATPVYKQAVLDTLNNTIFGKFNITFTATKPISGEYSTVLVGGACASEKMPAALGILPTTTGQAESIDIGNKDRNDVAVVLVDHFPEGLSPTARSLAQSIGHQTGHLLGLYNINDSSQIMFSGKNDALDIGGPSTIAGSSAIQDATLELSHSLGMKDGSTLGDISKLTSQTLLKYGFLHIIAIGTTLYDAQLGLMQTDGQDSSGVYVDLGKVAPHSIKPFQIKGDVNTPVVFMAKSIEGGSYDVFSWGSGGAPGVFDPGSFPLSLGNIPFGLVKVGGSTDSGSSWVSLGNLPLPFGLKAAGLLVAPPLGFSYATISDKPVYSAPLLVSDLNSKPTSQTLGRLVDFDGIYLGGVDAWKIKAQVDVNGDGSKEIVLFNKTIGRWATLEPDANNVIDLDDHSWGGTTRVVGIYIDPLVSSGTVVKGSAFDSQARFQNDLRIDNIGGVLGAGDYNRDGLQEIYFALTDKTAVLHAFMHLDGNIQYANYQNASQLASYLSSNGYSSAYYKDWLV